MLGKLSKMARRSLANSARKTLRPSRNAFSNTTARRSVSTKVGDTNAYTIVDHEYDAGLFWFCFCFFVFIFKQIYKKCINTNNTHKKKT